MDVVGAIGGAIGAAVWVFVGTRLVSRLRPDRQMPVFTIGVIAFALAGGLLGSTVEIGDAAGPTKFVSTAGAKEPTPSGVLTPPPAPEPTTATTTTIEPSTTTSTAPTTTTTRKHTTTVRHRTTTRRATTAATSRTVTARCMDGWGIYGTNRDTTACNAHGGIDYWIVQPSN